MQSPRSFSFVGLEWRRTCEEAGVRKDTSLNVVRWGRAEAPPWRLAEGCHLEIGRLPVWPGFST